VPDANPCSEPPGMRQECCDAFLQLVHEVSLCPAPDQRPLPFPLPFQPPIPFPVDPFTRGRGCAVLRRVSTVGSRGEHMPDPAPALFPFPFAALKIFPT
jgi:hypothetical protein